VENLAAGFAVISSHVFTTNPPRFPTQKTTFCRPEFAKTPAKTPFPAQNRKLKKKKKTPKPFRGSGAIGLQTARKPNSVLDDHSSTRRITAAL
jgi:hypothetical protein